MCDEIDLTEVENAFEQVFEKIKKLLIVNIQKEIENNIESKSINDFFEYLINSQDIKGFFESNAEQKFDCILSWFRSEAWTLEDAVYDFTRDDFDGEMPNEEFETN